jgi:hypothetical protein
MRRRRRLPLSVLLIILTSATALIAQSSTADQTNAQSPDQSGAPPTGQTSTKSTDHTEAQPTDQANPQPTSQTNPQPTDQTPTANPSGTTGNPDPNAQQPANPAPTGQTAQNPGVRTGGVSASDKVTIGGYGSVRYETNSLEEPKAAGFDFRRFVLTADATPSDRLQAYIEIEFERFGEIEIERALNRTLTGTAFTEDIEGGNGSEISLEQMWGQFKFSDKFSVRFGQVLVPLGRFNLNHDDDRWDIPRRTLVDRNVPILPVKAAWTELGAGFVGSLSVGKSGQLTYQAYLVNGATLDFAVEKAVESEANEPGIIKLASEFSLQRGPVNGEGGVRAGGWRVMYSPMLNYEIAVSEYVGGYTPDFFDPSDARLNAWGLDGLLKHGAFQLEGEYIHTHFGNIDGVAKAFVDAVTGSTGRAPLAGADGTEAEFALKDLNHARQGFWLEGRYSFWPMKWQKNPLAKGFEDPRLTWVLRYERATVKDLIDEISIENGEISISDPQTLRQERTTIGLAYRPIQSVVFSVAMEHNRRLEGPVLLFPFGQPSQAYTSLLAGLAFGF